MGDNTFNVAGSNKPLNLNEDFAGGTSPIFIGEADPGTADSAAKWRIQKRTYSSRRLTKIRWANGNGNFDKKWTDRTSFVYTT